ncbi:DUF2203 domain-containing protein [Mechercharimyces sp. CAU 1602]|uniref:DUF2203 domain-containing protein n=1 Tax=Mechercharimyces sp. CAU 1602 TaxID=2973933 RepID=UPI0021626716|nr:DUF2203 domain-containing protein [Mechercharimyces sp. CAU 1602]MCS1351945.1 DUF2203 domain-containing protein [Mechercharimyces sp. CAU 1602]
MNSEQKVFTRDEANQLLPELSVVLDHLRMLKQQQYLSYLELQQLQTAMREIVESEKPRDPYFAHEVELEFLHIQMRSGIEEVKKTGAILKDIDHGVVDFPAWIDHGEAFYCWQYGEKEVTHWHHVWEGFHARKKIPTDNESSEEE